MFLSSHTNLVQPTTAFLYRTATTGEPNYNARSNTIRSVQTRKTKTAICRRNLVCLRGFSTFVHARLFRTECARPRVTLSKHHRASFSVLTCPTGSFSKANSLVPPRDPTDPLLAVLLAMPARLRTDEQPAASALIARERSSLRASFVLRLICVKSDKNFKNLNNKKNVLHSVGTQSCRRFLAVALDSLHVAGAL